MIRQAKPRPLSPESWQSYLRAALNESKKDALLGESPETTRLGARPRCHVKGRAAVHVQEHRGLSRLRLP